MHRISLFGMNYLTLARWLAIGWTIVMLIGCLTPHSQIPEVLTTWNDKFEHIAIFALWVPLAGNWLSGNYRPHSRTYLWGLDRNSSVPITN